MQFHIISFLMMLSTCYLMYINYPRSWESRYYWFGFALNNPFRIRLNKKYSLGLIFNPPHVYKDKNPFELSRDFFYTTAWKVEQVNDTPKFTGQLITDKEIYNKK